MSRVTRDNLGKGVAHFRDIALKEGFDLVQIHENQDPNYFIKEGI